MKATRELISKVLIFIIIPFSIITFYILDNVNPSVKEFLGTSSDLTAFFSVLLTYYLVASAWWTIWRIQKVQETESRPYIIVDFEINKGMVSLVVTNIGKTPAKNIKISVIPEIVNYAKKDLTETIFSEPMEFLPPGKRFVAFINTYPALLKNKTPLAYEFTINYYGNNKKRPYDEKQIINLGYFKECIITEQKDIDDIYSVLDKCNKQLESISRSFDNFNIKKFKQYDYWNTWEEKRPTESEKELIIEANNNAGEIYLFSDGRRGDIIQISDKEYYDEHDPMVRVIALESFDMLFRRGLIRYEGGACYCLTGGGFNVAKECIENHKKTIS